MLIKMSNADFFKTYFNQVWMYKKTFKDYLLAFKPNFQFLMQKVSTFK
jgi:hypothetical protein